MNSRRLFIVCAASALLTACADRKSPWENDSVPKSQWASDERDCQRIAARQTDQDFAGMEDRFATTGGASGPRVSDFDRMEARENRRRLFARCMRERGYRQVRREEE